MIDPELIQLCADPRLEVEIAQQFVSEIDAADYLTVHVAEGQPQDVGVLARDQRTGHWRHYCNRRVGLVDLSTKAKIGQRLTLNWTALPLRMDA